MCGRKIVDSIKNHGFGAKKIKREPMIMQKEIAEKYGLSEDVIYDRMKRFPLDHVSVKNKKYYKPSDVSKWWSQVLIIAPPKQQNQSAPSPE
jgi:hypothetical protein